MVFDYTVLVTCVVIFGNAPIQVTAKDYKTHLQFIVAPSDTYQEQITKHLEDFRGVSSVSHFRRSGAGVRFLVDPKVAKLVEHILLYNNITFSAKSNQAASRRLGNFKYPECLPVPGNRRSLSPSKSELSFQKYERYADIQNYLINLEQTKPKYVELVNIGKSFEGRNLTAIRISKFDFGANGKKLSNKPAILIDAGIHAREWLAPAFALYIISQLAENSEKYMDLLDNLDFYIIPLINPDGYEYSHTDDRYWRKTRSIDPESDCIGVDANRNFGFHWETSTDSCAENYAGKVAFSEMESRALRDFGLTFGPRLKLYLSLHAYGPLILYPWGFSQTLPTNYLEMDALARFAAMQVQGPENAYQIGSSTRVLYKAAGGSDDWFLAVPKVPFAYTMELPEGDGITGFEMSETQILKVCIETWPVVREFARQIKAKFGNQMAYIMRGLKSFKTNKDLHRQYL